MSHKNTRAVINMKVLSFRSWLSSNFTAPAHCFMSLGGWFVGVRLVIFGWLIHSVCHQITMHQAIMKNTKKCNQSTCLQVVNRWDPPHSRPYVWHIKQKRSIWEIVMLLSEWHYCQVLQCYRAVLANVPTLATLAHNFEHSKFSLSLVVDIREVVKAVEYFPMLPSVDTWRFY